MATNPYATNPYAETEAPDTSNPYSRTADDRKPAGAFRKLADAGLAFGQGAAGGTKALTDSLGASNTVSKALDSAAKGMGAMMSDEARQEIAARQKTIKDAEASGSAINEIGANLGGLAEAPVRTIAQGAGSIVPTMAAALLTRGKSLAPLVGIGAAQGAGAVKGSIYDAVEQKQIEAGMSPADAQAAASKAQEYTGANAGNIAVGGALGALASRVGAEGAVLGGGARGAFRTGAKAAGEEALTEGAQGGQERYSSNVAEQRQGFDTPTWQGVAGQAVSEGVIGGIVGGGVGAVSGAMQPPAQGLPVGGPDGAGVAPSGQVTAGPPLAPVQEQPAGLPPIDAGAITQPGQTAPGMGFDPNAVTLDTLPTSGELPVIHPSFGPLSAAASLLAGPDGVIHAPLPVLDQEQTGQTAKTAEKKLGAQPSGKQPAGSVAAPLSSAQDAGPSVTSPAASSQQPSTIQSGQPQQGQQQPSPSTDDLPRNSGSRPPVASATTQLQTAPAARPVQSGQSTGTEPSQSLGASEGAPLNTPSPTSQQEPQTQPRPKIQASGSSNPGGVVVAPDSSASQPPAKEPIVPRETSTSKENPSAPEAPEAVQGSAQRRQEPATQGAAPVDASGAATEPAKAPAVEGVAQGAASGAAVIDEAAHAAATSPRNDLPEPTDAQKKAGNYAKGHVKLAGMDLSIENPAESVRSGKDRDGKAWSNTLKSHYGYFRGTMGNDKDHVDAFIKPDTPTDYAGPVFVVDQVHPDTGRFDEHKVLIGFQNALQARQAYQANYAKGWKGLKNITAMPMDEFKAWVFDGAKNKPLAPVTGSAPANRASGVQTSTDQKDDKTSRPQSGGVAVPSESSPSGVSANDPSPSRASETPPSLSRTLDNASPDPTPTAPAGKVVSTFTGKFGKGMSEGNAKIAAINKNKTNTDPSIVYAAEEHGLPDMTGEWAVIGRKVDSNAAPKAPSAGTVRILNDDEYAAKLADEAKNSKPPSKQPVVASANTIFTEDAAAAARARLKSKLGRLNSGIDPETMLDGITLAGYHIEKGARTFAAYAKAMLDDLGDGVKPYLKSWYMGVRYDPRASGFDGMSSAADVDKSDVDALEPTPEKADTSPNGDRNGNENTQPGVASGDPRAVPDAQGERGTPAQPGPAPVDPGNVEARKPEDVGEPAAGDADGATGVRPASEDVGSPGGTDTGGPAGDGRKGAGGKGKPATRARSRSGSRANPAVVDPKTVSPANTGPGDFVIDDPLKIVGGGQVARFDKNKAAIEMRNMLVEAGRAPTREEQTVLAGYTGWGSFGQELFQGNWAKPAPKPAWEARDQWLRENLGQKEWEGLQTSIINAHFTDPPTVLAMWDMVRKMGFTGGRTLEPSIGIGNFYGMMPVDMVGRSQRAGIELDPVTGSMAQMLYPNANIQIKGYEESKTPDNFYDLVIGNWPFFEHGPADRRYNRLSPTLHDYFFLKAIDQTRPGGLVVGITSKGTMDKKGIGARMEMARKAELIAAFRLPTGAFAEYAGTAVVTDIIILRKRDKPMGIVAGEGWIETKDHPTREGTAVPVNEYFHTHPDHVIGEIDFGHGTTTFRPGLIVHRPDGMMDHLKRIAGMVPDGAFKANETGKHISYVANHTKDRTNSLVDTPQGLFVVHGEHLAPANEIQKYELKDPKGTEKRVAELKAMIGLRQLYGALIDAERGDGKAEDARTALRTAYESFVKTSGPVSKSFGLQYLRRLDDPFYPAIAALENATTSAGGKVSYRPAKILTESTMRGARAITSPTIIDAFVLARNESVNPTIARIAEIAGKPESDVRSNLVGAGAGFEMPNGDFAPADVYLSGNVRAKLREARAALQSGSEAMARNVEALEKVVPEDIPYYKIETQMGATWVPPSTYTDFVGHMLGMTDTSEIEVGFTAGSWKIEFPSQLNHRAEARSGYGSPNVKFKRLVRAAIANQTITVKFKDSDGVEHVLDEETKEVNGKIADMRLNFGEWLWSDPVRRTALEREYNEVRNAYATPQFDGSFLGFQGMALSLGSGPFNLREHQVNAIWRGLVTRKSLNAHEVGTGKTFTMGGIAVESRRYGIAKKPILFAHNANSKSVSHEIQMMYPSAKVLYVDNLSRENIKTRMMQIANDDWDVIVMPHSIIDRIGFKEETLMSMAQEELKDLEQAAEEAASEDGVSISSDMWENEEELNKLRSVTAKQLVKQRLKILTTIRKLAQQGSREDSVAFEDMGVDMLLVDEAHEFKKPPIATKMKLKGLQTATSNRSISMMFLTKYVRSMHDGGNVHLFTGTPITNTMTEVFHMMRYMMQEEMKDVALSDWDGWFGSFAREVNDVELTSTGEYEAVTRLQSFINVPELRRMIGQYMDVVFSDDMPEMKPRAVNGKLLSDKALTEAERAQLLNGRTEGAKDRPYKKVVNESSDMSPDQQTVFAEVQQYANRWKNMSKKDRKDAMTRGAPESPIIHEGIANKASFDVRLVDAIENAGKEGTAEMDPHPDSKAARTIKNLLEIYRGHDQAAQVVFMSQGMAKSVTRREGPVGGKRDVTHPAFSTMHDMIERLVAAGVPRDQIAAVDGSTSKDRRKEVADAMNDGRIRIVFGSTGSLGVGVNMQRNLRAMHHMDAPWMPGDLEQRNGRGHRQGNQWNTVLEYRYITDRLDGKRWQTLARKQKFITDFMKSKGDVRVIDGDVASEDQDDILSTFSEAAGDPRILMREKFKKNLEQLRSRERLHGIARSDAAGNVKSEQRDIATNEKQLADVKESGLVAHMTTLLDSQRGDGFTMTVDGKTVTTRADAAAAIFGYVADMRIGDDKVIGTYGDLTLNAEWDKFSPSPNLYVKVSGHNVESNGPSLASLESGLRNLRDTAESTLETRIARGKERMAHAKSVAAEPFHMADKLQKTQQQLDDLERDIDMNPVAPPYWLRNGAAIDTEVFRDGKPFTVTGHRWTNSGWYVAATDEKGDVNIPYMEAMDSQGMPLYEEHEFTQPTVTAQNAAASQAANATPAQDDDLSFNTKDDAPFYSALAREVSAIPAKSQGNVGWAMNIAGLVKAGKVKQDEVNWTGVLDWLRLQEGKVTREQVSAFLDQNGVQVQETVLGKEPARDQYRAELRAMSRDELAARYEEEMSADPVEEYGETWNPESLIDEMLEVPFDAMPGEAGEDGTRYGQYQLPGGTNYREVLLTLPVKSSADPARAEYETWASRNGLQPNATFTEERYKRETGKDAPAPRTMTAMNADASQNFRSSHWTQPNVLAHIRVNDRVDADGKKVLFVEEIQSDWGQEGKKKGFRGTARGLSPIEEARFQDLLEEGRRNLRGADLDEFQSLIARRDAEAENRNAPPSAPFVTKTDAWLSLALKRIVKMAADGGYERVAFVNGEQSAARYDLSKQLSAVHLTSDRGGKRFGEDHLGPVREDIFPATLDADGMNGQRVMSKDVDNEEQLADFIGKEAARKLIDAERGTSSRGFPKRSLSGLDLKVGGEGMVAFYDRIVPNTLKDVLKKFGGGALETVEIVGQAKAESLSDFGSYAEFKAAKPQAPQLQQPGFTVTPAMREKASGGLPMFAQAAYTPANGQQQSTADFSPQAVPRIEHLDRSISNYLGGAGTTARPFQARRLRDHAALQGLADAFGATIQGFRVDPSLLAKDQETYGFFNGVYTGGTVYLNDDSQRPHLAVLGHELAHHLAKTEPLRYQQLVRAIRPFVDPAKYPAFAKTAVGRNHANNEDKLREEFIGEVLSDGFMNRDFWRAVGKSNPNLLQRIVRIVSDLLNSALAKLGYTNRTEQYLTDFNRVMQIAGEVMGEYGLKPPTVDFGELSFNRADGQAQSANTDIRFNTKDGAVQTLRSMTDRLMEATSPIGTVSLWDKTVGTQYNKSTKDADFKRVFDGFYQQTDDTAHYAIESERHAPDVLMRLESLGDVWKGLMQSGSKQKADLAAVSKALFANIEGVEGVKQVEYDDRNLRDLFNLTPKQIELYRQVRTAVNTSIDRLAQTYAAQFGQQQGMDIGRLKNMSLEDTVDSVKRKIKDDHDEAVAQAKLRASVAAEDKGPVSKEQAKAAKDALAAQLLALDKATDALTKRLDLMQEHATFLRENAYMPALRFGEYAVTVTQEDADGKNETLHFEMFESQMAANLAAMRLRKEYPQADVSKSVLNKQQYEMFKGVSPETVALFAKFTGADKNEAVQNYIALAKSSRSVLMRQLKRKGVAGFSQDATRVLASFVTSNARQAAINMNQGAISDALASKSLARKGDVQREAQKLAQYMNNPLEEARRLRGFMFMHFMGGSVASALVNMTQPVLQTTPYLHQFAGSKTAGIMLSSARMAASGKIENMELRHAAQRAAEDGITEPHEIHQLMADAGSSGLGNNLRARAAVKAWGSFFSLAEAYNRRVTFIAAYQVAKSKNMPNPYEFARIAVIETQGLYGKVNRPNWARGAVGATLFTFKQFSISYIEFIRRLPPKQKAIALGILVLAAGLQGLPFAEDVEDLIDTIGQSLGYNTNSKKALRKFLIDNMGQDLGSILDSGIFTQTAVDVQGRLGMGNLLPGTSIFKPSETNKGRTMGELVGPLGGVLEAAQKALGAAQRGDLVDAGKEMAPVAVKNFLKGVDMAMTGIYKDTRGYKVADVTAAESFMKMLGLQPGTIAEKTRKMSDQWQDKSMVTMMESQIADAWAKGIFDKDPDQVARARKTLAEWNERNPDSRIQIGFPQIRRRVQQMNQTREQRFVKTVPKELRAGVARELAQ